MWTEAPLPGFDEPPAPPARVEISRLRHQGYGYTEIARSLNQRGVPTSSGRGRWHPATVRRTVNPDGWAAYIRSYRARS